MGLDIGDRRIGVALSDPQGVLASPFTVFERRDDEADVGVILDIVGEKEVGQVIVGLPYSMNGSIGRQAEKVKVFTEKLCGQIGVPVEFRDERLSTVSAKRRLSEANTKLSRKRVQDDAAAAAIILQDYLDEKRESF